MSDGDTPKVVQEYSLTVNDQDSSEFKLAKHIEPGVLQAMVYRATAAVRTDQWVDVLDMEEPIERSTMGLQLLGIFGLGSDVSGGIGCQSKDRRLPAVLWQI